MSKKLFIRKEFDLTENDIQNIYGYLQVGETFKMKSFLYEEEDFSVAVEMIPVKGRLQLKCSLWRESDSKALYKTTYKLDSAVSIYDVFMIDTNNTEFNELKIEVEEDIEFYFTFNTNLPYKNKTYIQLNDLCRIKKEVSNIFALAKYSSVTNYDVFRLCVEIVNNIKGIKSFRNKTKDLTYFVTQLEFLKDKLSYVGYDEDYLNRNYIEFKNIKTEEDVFNYYVVVALDYLYDNSCYLMVDKFDLYDINKTYFEGLMDYLS